MNISLILDPYGEDKPGGLGRAVLEMVRGIVARGPARDYTIYVKSEPKVLPIEDERVRTIALGVRQLWLSGGKKLSRKSDLHVFFTPMMPLLFFPRKSIVVVHDFAYLELPQDSLRQKLVSAILYCLHKISLHKATAVVAISEAAKESIVRHFRIAPEKIRVIYNGFISSGSDITAIETPEKFFLFAGVLKARKNVLGIIRAFAEFAGSNQDYFLLIAGKTGGAYAEEAQQLADDLGISPRVRFLGYVTDGQLAYLYTKAAALVFPSFVEGFGMPVIEAMDRGLPVITSQTGPLAEVAGDAALLVDPYNPGDIARAMHIFSRDEALREEYIARGRARAAQFSWEKNGREFTELIDSI